MFIFVPMSSWEASPDRSLLNGFAPNQRERDPVVAGEGSTPTYCACIINRPFAPSAT